MFPWPDPKSYYVKTDYTSKLGSLIAPDMRPYYRDHNFRILKSAVKDRLSEMEKTKND